MQQLMRDDVASGRREELTQEVGVRRLEAFSDGIFAIAITLLALNLHMPDLRAVDQRALAPALAAQWPTYLTFVLSFATVLIAWVYHYRLLQLARHSATALLFANGLVLLFISAVPFPTALLGSYLITGAVSVACAIYASYIAVLNGSYNVLWGVVVRQHHGLRSGETRLSTNMLLSWLGFPCYLAAVAIAFWSPVATLVICGTLWGVWAVRAPGPAARRRRDAARPRGASGSTSPPTHDGGSVDSNTKPAEFAVSPALGPVPPIFVPRSPRDEDSLALAWHALIPTVCRVRSFVDGRLQRIIARAPRGSGP